MNRLIGCLVGFSGILVEKQMYYFIGNSWWDEGFYTFESFKF